jgi:hypothetical protein
MERWSSMMSRKGFRRRSLWHIWKYYSIIYLEGLTRSQQISIGTASSIAKIQTRCLMNTKQECQVLMCNTGWMCPKMSQHPYSCSDQTWIFTTVITSNLISLQILRPHEFHNFLDCSVIWLPCYKVVSIIQNNYKIFGTIWFPILSTNELPRISEYWHWT